MPLPFLAMPLHFMLCCCLRHLAVIIYIIPNRSEHENVLYLQYILTFVVMPSPAPPCLCLCFALPFFLHLRHFCRHCLCLAFPSLVLPLPPFLALPFPSPFLYHLCLCLCLCLCLHLAFTLPLPLPVPHVPIYKHSFQRTELVATLYFTYLQSWW